MEKRQEASIKPIMASDIKRRHPRYLTCQTDKAYANLANSILTISMPRRHRPTLMR